MKVYPSAPLNTMPAAREAAGAAPVIAVRLADLVPPSGRPAAEGDRTALVVAGTPVIRTGDTAVFVKVIAVAPAVVRRDGRVQAGGHPADHARLGAAEQQLDDLIGPGVIDQVAGQVTLTGKVKGKARRAMTAALALRASLLMGLMPNAGYGEIMAALLGDLVLVPWQRKYQVPTAKVLCTWRQALGPAPLAGLQARLLAAADAEHRDHDYRAVHVGDLRLGSIDGSVTRVPDTPANREAFGSTGTADDSAPYPQVRDLLATDASTRAALAVVSGPSGAAAGGSRDKGEAEQVLLDAMLTTCRQIFTADRLWVLDRNFPGAGRVSAMLATGTHVLIRVKSDLALPRTGGFLPDGSYYSYLAGGPPAARWCLKIRVIEYLVDVGGQDTGEMFCLITDLLDYVACPAADLAAAYAWRWPGSETALKEAKSAITGAAILALGISTGARASELLGVRGCDLTGVSSSCGSAGRARARSSGFRPARRRSCGSGCIWPGSIRWNRTSPCGGRCAAATTATGCAASR